MVKLALVLAAALLALPASAAAFSSYPLTPVGCVEELPLGAGCAAGVASFGGSPSVGDVVVAPDGGHVYVTAGSGTVTWFNRAADGSLALGGCIRDPAPTQAESCGAVAPGLKSAMGLAISPDGSDLYVACWSGSVTQLRRGADGSLSGGACVQDPAAARGCALLTAGLGGASDLVVSPDGPYVYVAARLDDAIVRLARAADGSLTPLGCVEDTGAGNGCAASTGGLDGAASLAFAPASPHLYAASAEDGALRRFTVAANGRLSRGTASTPRRNSAAPANSTVWRASQTVPLACIDTNGDPLTIEIVRGPGERRAVGRRPGGSDGRLHARSGVLRRRHVRVPRERRGRRVGAGPYVLRLAATSADGQVVRDSARLRLRR